MIIIDVLLMFQFEGGEGGWRLESDSFLCIDFSIYFKNIISLTTPSFFRETIEFNTIIVNSINTYALRELKMCQFQEGQTMA